MKKWLLVDDFHPALMEGLLLHGIDFDYRPDIDETAIRACISRYSGLLIRSKMRVDRTLIESASQLCFIGRGGSGLDNIDERACAERNITLFNAAGANADAVGEQTLAMLLSLFTNLHKADAEVRRGIWDREGNRGLELAGRTVGIIGFGHTGSAFARKLSGLGVRVLAYDKHAPATEGQGVEPCELVNLLSESDIVSFHVPLTPETRYWVNDVFIDSLSRPIWLLNLSRGEVVDTAAVWRAIQSGKIRGFAADVLEREPPMDLGSPIAETLRAMSADYRCVLAPHIGGWTHESYRKISEELLHKSLLIMGLVD